MPQHVGSKRKKTSALLQEKSLKPLVLTTVTLNRSSLGAMLAKYGMVYVKPNVGTHGNGVMKVEHADGRYRFQLGLTPLSYKTYDQLFAAIRRRTGGKDYLVQRGIRLLKYKGRRFDLRVMVQWTPRRTWETTGIIGRVAAPRKIVTNYHSGGTLMAPTNLLTANMGKGAADLKLRSLRIMGMRAGQALRRRFPRVCEIGLDVGLDESAKPWIIEVNTMPDPYIFRKLGDPSIFRKIRRYAKAYGR
ncbi:YheC/YheD family protein [Cohnella endophytica]|uniref:YheC/YheD family protein n=1 Tax=Cohnella endophytica TaxID=2419778 RepID=A0A494Y1G9_9BACL|nr:YheC/YheD family protein [Cohnella endophytica]RKP54192.1 YheC/YheD family protein [Cohnella endophytica]